MYDCFSLLLDKVQYKATCTSMYDCFSLLLDKVQTCTSMYDCFSLRLDKVQYKETANLEYTSTVSFLYLEL